jgi:hypothetical protein
MPAIHSCSLILLRRPHHLQNLRRKIGLNALLPEPLTRVKNAKHASASKSPSCFGGHKRTFHKKPDDAGGERNGRKLCYPVGYDMRTRSAEISPMNAQDEIERLKHEVERLQKALGERQQLSAPLPQSLLENYEFIVDCARFAEGNFSEAAMRRKYHLDEATWTALGNDEALIERVEYP